MRRHDNRRGRHLRERAARRYEQVASATTEIRFAFMAESFCTQSFRAQSIRIS
jgi:hypothetical protein